MAESYHVQFTRVFDSNNPKVRFEPIAGKFASASGGVRSPLQDETELSKAAGLLKCVLCKKIPKDPVASSCDCLFCRVCLESHLRLSDQICPDCETNLTEVIKETPRDKKQIRRLRFSCRNKLAYNRSLNAYTTEGWEGERCLSEWSIYELDHHLESCQFEPVLCPHSNQGCTFIGLRKHISDHLQKCLFKSVLCICGSVVLVQDLVTHQERVCPHTEVDCPHSKFGYCKEIFPRSSLEKHLKHCPVEQCLPLVNNQQGRIQSLEEEIKQLKKDKEDLKKEVEN